MNALERLLSDELIALMDRLAASVPDGVVEQTRGATPTLHARLEDMDARLAAAHAALVDDYRRWRRALDDLENVWALAAWRASAEAPPRASEIAA